jgi:8-amino-7-oxononanoate synthase
MEQLKDRITKIKSQDRYRVLKQRHGPQASTINVDGQHYLNFCSNDYLGLANHPKVKEAFVNAVNEYGVGSGASHLINGHTAAHQALEDKLAELTGREKALLFSTGYMANLGVVNTLVGKTDAVFEDRLNHASLLDAGLSSGARFRRYKHADIDDLKKQLDKSVEKQKLIMTDGVFSMDGDIAPIRQLSELASQYDAWLMVDDAHGIGVLGEDGAGVLQMLGLGQSDVPVLMATLGKALGTAGAFIAGSEELIDTLIQQSRTYIYTTAMPPALAAATLASIETIQQEGWRRQQVLQRVAEFKRAMATTNLQLMPSDTPIQPVLLGSELSAMQASEKLLSKGLMVSAIRPPTVEKGMSRLRVTITAEHTAADIDKLVEGLSKI